MTELRLNIEMILVGIPMIVVLLASSFRMEELISRPRKLARSDCPLSGCDQAGRAICVEPDGSTLGYLNPPSKRRQL